MNIISQFLACTFFLVVLTVSSVPDEELNARAHIAGESRVSGVINFTDSRSTSGIRIFGRITGLTPGRHGFHVHQYGDVFTKGCYSAGPHFNPTNAHHGGPQDSRDRRHAGDLGNVIANRKGIATIDIQDKIMTLSSPNSILGRAIVIHANEDDLGRRNNEESKKTGNSGPHLACGIIAIVP